MDIVERITQEVRHLPEPLAQEVLDFIQYLEFKHGLIEPDIENLKKAQLPAMKALWDNPEDEVWDAL